MRAPIISILFLLAAIGVQAADGPKLDVAKYPQDTPHNAVKSIVKALENKDLGYWIAWLMVPDDSKKLIAKYGSLEQAAKTHAEAKHAAHITQCHVLMKKMLDANQTSEGEENGVKWVRFQDGQTLLQLEKQPDGRWSMNTKVAK